MIEGEAEVVENEPHTSRGRTPGATGVPESLRSLIGEEAVINGRQSALGLAKEFNISPSSVSAYARGAASTASYNQPVRRMVEHLNKARARAVKRATKTLDASLGAISQEKLDYSDAKDLAGIAKDMSVIIKNLEPQALPPEDAASKSPQFVIYAPSFKREENYEVIQVVDEVS